MSSDPLLTAAISHWGPRFVANGVVLTDFEEVTASLSSYNDWCRAWSARAAHDPAQMKAAHKKQIECRQLALPHLSPPGERVEIPYEGKALAGILRKPVG